MQQQLDFREIHNGTSEKLEIAPARGISVPGYDHGKRFIFEPGSRPI
jgi:hypothetical protein